MNLRDYAQSDTYIGQYMRMLDAQETPLAYDFWCACWTIGAAIGRKHHILRPQAPVYLNPYLILVADSGITRKSTSVGIATRVVREFSVTGNRDIAILDGKVTAQHLLQSIIDLNNGGHDGNIALSISELAATIGRSGGAHELPVLLTDLYDSPEFRSGGSRTHGAYEVQRVYMSLLAASTPAWLHRAVNPNVVEGGFTSRCIFVVSDKRKRKVAWPEEISYDYRAEQITSLVSELRARRSALDAREYSGITANSAAKRTFSEWYASRKLASDIYRSSFDSRADAHVLRMAGTLCISDRSYTIGHRHVVQAIDLIEHAREDGVRLFAGGNTDTTPKHVRAFDRLRKVLTDAGRDGLAQGKVTLALAHFADASMVVRILEAMHDMDMVQKTIVMSGAKGGRTKTLWRATKLIHSSGAQQLVEYLARPSTIVERAATLDADEDHQT